MSTQTSTSCISVAQKGPSKADMVNTVAKGLIPEVDLGFIVLCFHSNKLDLQQHRGLPSITRPPANAVQVCFCAVKTCIISWRADKIRWDENSQLWEQIQLPGKCMYFTLDFSQTKTLKKIIYKGPREQRPALLHLSAECPICMALFRLFLLYTVVSLAGIWMSAEMELNC